nr:MAG TPA: hypothetical protein [Caudoviricetes sp.]
MSRDVPAKCIYTSFCVLSAMITAAARFLRSFFDHASH